MKATVCELPHDWTCSAAIQRALSDHLQENQTDLLLLPEMPFYKWLSGSNVPDPLAWQAAVSAHDGWMEKLKDLRVPMVAGTRPILKNGHPINTAFVWTREKGVQYVHEKYYLPNEEGFWEATWYEQGDGAFEVVEVNGIRIGFLICTEMWFTRHARDYSKQGIHLLLCPRATPVSSASTWVAGGRSAAWISGAFCLSSNFNGPNTPDMAFGGTGWITEPDGGQVLGLTAATTPFLTREIDIQAAVEAKKTYPRYVQE
ncbi:MAG: carbon-nitrogen hydrolase family protein [Proteobacteria bacterium]|nr:carbon-nitrogen hydrolase family protein [Desulfobacula sp.]MBU3953609.1 carbon-nitrogen hydrolase family protein [Pseudomonadota bacterium]MBU4132497.1 carbon-nitrogen hydrolase family protein [Pseudomonadota bacterium]